MAIIVIFLLGIGNFAMHRAVMESKNPLLRQVPWFASAKGRRIALVREFVVLLAALLLAANGWPALVWGYVMYTAINAGSAWMILSGRV